MPQGNLTTTESGIAAPRARGTRRRVRRRQTGVRSGAATGIGAGGNTNVDSGSSRGVTLAGLTSEQRKFYELGQRHACEMHGINWSGSRRA